jgi:hypothetical protein
LKATLDTPNDHVMNLFDLNILAQPTDESCGATCLHAIYKYYGIPVELGTLIEEIPVLETGGTLAVILGTNALEKGFKATIYTYNLQVFDPTWFQEGVDLADKIRKQMKAKKKAKIHFASLAYLKFLELGGSILFDELDSQLLRTYLDRHIPILTGLNATYLYRWPREFENEDDDIKGKSMGHFVVLYGYDKANEKVLIADPLLDNPFSQHRYPVNIDRVINSILLGILTYDANFLVIEKANRPWQS